MPDTSLEAIGTFENLFRKPTFIMTITSDLEVYTTALQDLNKNYNLLVKYIKDLGLPDTIIFLNRAKKEHELLTYDVQFAINFLTAMINLYSAYTETEKLIELRSKRQFDVPRRKIYFSRWVTDRKEKPLGRLFVWYDVDKINFESTTRDFKYTPDGYSLMRGGKTNMVIRNSKWRKVFNVNVRSICLSSEGLYVATEHSIYVLNADSGVIIRKIDVQLEGITAMTILNIYDADILIIATRYGNLLYMYSSFGVLIQHIEFKRDREITNLGLYEDKIIVHLENQPLNQHYIMTI
jgi:hypothetical protein